MHLELLALVCVLGALRCLPEPAVRWEEDATAWQGIWRTRREGDTEIRGAMAIAGTTTPIFELPGGCVRDGDELRILRGAQPVPRARGPRLDSVDADEMSVAAPARELVVAHADEVLRLATPIDTGGWMSDARSALERRASRLEDARAASLARAFLLGDSTALDPETTDLFTRNGLRHVLAVSGWHVAMMALLIVRPFSSMAEVIAARLPRRGRLLAWASMLASAALCIAYVPLTGGGAPVRRAALAVALASTAAFWPRAETAGNLRASRRIDALSLWAAALSVECALEPMAITDVAVQLSYAATLGLIVGTSPLMRWLAQCLGLDDNPSPQSALQSWPRQCASAFGRRCLRTVLGGVAASIAAVLATAPIVWLTFGEACPWGVLTTPLLAPLFLALFVFGMLMLAAPASIFGTLFSATGDGLLSALEAVDLLPGTPALLPERPAWLLFGLLLLGWILVRERHAAAPALRAAAGLGAALLVLPWAPAAGRFELHVLDVGHGTCVAFRAPGEPCWIFDCGSRDRSRVAQDSLAPLLRAWDVPAPVVVLSHTDSDHCGGLRWVIERAPPQRWIGALPAPLAERLAHTCPREDPGAGAMRLAEAAPEFSLWLVRGSTVQGNEGSRSLLMRVGEQALLLCGDAVDEGWALPLREGLLRGQGGILLAAHHGSEGARIGALLDAWAPSEVWVSSPAPPGIARELERRAIPWKGTARDGPISWAPP